MDVGVEVSLSGCSVSSTRGLVTDAFRRFSAPLFKEFGTYAVVTQNISDILELALGMGDFENAAMMLTLYARIHDISFLGDLLMNEDFVVNDRRGAVLHLIDVFRRLRASHAMCDTFTDFATHICCEEGGFEKVVA